MISKRKGEVLAPPESAADPLRRLAGEQESEGTFMTKKPVEKPGTVPACPLLHQQLRENRPCSNGGQWTVDQ